MLWRMLGVDSWLDVASLENVEEDHSFLFLKKSLMKIFFFFLNFWKPEFFEGLENFDFFFLWKIWKSWIFSRNWKFWLMIFFFFFSFFFEKFGILNFWRNWKFWLMNFFRKIWKSWIFQGIENFVWWFFFFFWKAA